MKAFANLVVLFLLLACAGAQNTGAPADVGDLNITLGPDGVKIAVSLTAPVKARVTSVARSKRLTLELPNTTAKAKQQRVDVNQGGVKSVRMTADDKQHPGLTRMVVQLDQDVAYRLESEGNNVVLKVLSASPNFAKRSSRPAGAARLPLLGRLHRSHRQPALQEPSVAQSPATIQPPVLPPPLPVPSPSAAGQAGELPRVRSGEAVGTSNSAAPVSSAVAGDQSASPGNDSATQAGVTAIAESQAEASAPPQPNLDVRVAFQVKYVAEGVTYLDGGQNDGLGEGMKLVVTDADPFSGRPTSDHSQTIADLEVVSSAQTSSVAAIRSTTRGIKVGDWAYLSFEDRQSLVTKRSLSSTRVYPVVVTFTEGDPLDEDARVEVPRPPLPEINRSRGRIGFDYSGIAGHGATAGSSSSLGLMLRADITRIHGTYWNLSGYWRGRLSSQSAFGQQTLQDLINRTYHMQLAYDNPNSRWVAGFGRLYLPWATSLDTIDGGYFGRRVGAKATAGIFAGSTPDPTSWNYSLDRHIAGAFVNFEGGSYDDVHYTSTSGLGIDTRKWKIDRPFVFFENDVSYKRYLSIYHSLQADSPAGNPAVAAPGAGIGRSFLTVRIAPAKRLEFDLNHTYFRDLPTYDPQLVGTGLLDKYLFQGFSAGVRVEAMKNIWVYTTLGRSSRSGDAKASLNQLYGVTFGKLPMGVHTDVHYSVFNSSFGSGSYESLSLSRELHENLRFELLGGRQSFGSSLIAGNKSASFVTGSFEAALGRNYFAQSGYTWSRGSLQSYDQWFLTFGYRFDSKSKRK
jgi:AMIN domain